MAKMDFFGGKGRSSEMQAVLGNISQVEGEIRQKIYQLGQAYYEEFKGDPSIGEKYFAMVDQIVKLEQNRIAFFKQKLRLEGQMMCDSCGAVITYGSLFCNFCGQKTDLQPEGNAASGPTEQQAPRLCRNCGKELEEGSSFCTGCGQKIG